jgi:predicted KAP-like P-loop ATPase
VKDNHLRPLTIGIYGDWGVGKSSILSLLQKKVKALPDEERKKVQTIVFNSWLFQGYEDTKSALMETIVTDLARLQPNLE